MENDDGCSQHNILKITRSSPGASHVKNSPSFPPPQEEESDFRKYLVRCTMEQQLFLVN